MKSKSLNQSFVINIIFLIAINLLVKPVWVFVIERNVQLKLGFGNYGVYYALLNITYLFTAFLDLGLTNFSQKELAQNNASFSKLFGNIFSLKWLLALIYIAICIGFAIAWRYDFEKIKWLCWLAASQILGSFISFLRTTLSALQHYFLDSLISVLDKFLMIFIIGFFLFFDAENFSIQHFIIGQFVAYLLTFSVAIILVIRLKKPVETPAIVDFKSIIIQARPFTMLLLWMTIYFRLDSVLVERLTIKNAAFESGIYAAAYRLLDIVNMFAFLFSMLLFPMFNKLIAEKKSIHHLIQLSSPILLSVAWLVGCSMLVNHNKWFQLLYHRQDFYAAEVMLILMFSFFGVSLQYIYSTAVTAAGKLQIQNKGAFLAVGFNVICNFVFIPQYGALAAAIVAFITLSGMGIFNYILAKEIFKLEFSLKKFSVWMIWAVLSFSIFLFLSKFNLNLIIQQALLVAVCLGIGWMMKVLPFRNFMQILLPKKEVV